MSNLMKTLTIGDASYEICDASAREALEKIGTGGGISSWNDLTDKPFYEESNQTVIEWDGNTDGRDSFIGVIPSYKISDLTPSIDELVGGTITATTPNGDETVTIRYDDFLVEDGFISYHSGFVVAYKTEFNIDGTTITLPSTGIYAGVLDDTTHVSKLTYSSTTIHTLDEKFIPNTIARVKDIPAIADLTAAPTMEDFNNLLAALRNAGLMATE